MKPVQYDLKGSSNLKYKTMAVRAKELEIRAQLVKMRPDFSEKKKQKYAWMMANYAGGSRHGTFLPLDCVFSKAFNKKSKDEDVKKETNTKIQENQSKKISLSIKDTDRVIEDINVSL